MDAQIATSAFRHGLTEDDILHAYRNPIVTWGLLDELTMRVGAARNGALLEIGVAMRADHDLVVHAMPVRLKYLPGARNA